MTYIIDLNRLWVGSHLSAHKLLVKNQGHGHVSVVLVADGRYDLLRSLRHIVSQPFLREVIIVDMGLSSFLRKTLETFIKEYSQCQIINGREKAGLAEAYNLGAHYTSSDYVILMTENALLPKNVLARLYVFAKQKSSPCVVGLALKSRSSWDKSKDYWIGRLTGFHAKQPLQEETFSHTSTVRYEALFMSSRTFGILKGMDPDCFDETVAWDFCLRTHYSGGDVYQANHIKLTLQKQALSKNWRDHWVREWQRYHSWRYFYKKYARKQTNILNSLRSQLFFFFAFLHASLFH